VKTNILGGIKPEYEEDSVEKHRLHTLRSQVRISIFLGILILTVLVVPSLGFGHSWWYGNVVFTVLLGVGISIAWKRRGLFILSAIIGIAAVVLRWLAQWTPSPLWALSSEVATLLTIAILAWILLLQIFRRDGPITAVSIQAAISIYLLFGLAWANAYLIAMQLNPNSFQSSVSLSSFYVSEWYYYSYVTLTTLGYGEITPLTQAARALSVGEALTGQLYLAVLIARLIGMEIITYQENSERGSKLGLIPTAEAKGKSQ
jgi:Ion channel